MTGFSLAMFAITFLALAAVGFLVVTVRKSRFTKDARGRILDGAWISALELAEGYAEGSRYRDADGPGCYIILAFDHPVEDGDYSGYRAAYVGKGERACEAACARIAKLAAGSGDAADADGPEAGVDAPVDAARPDDAAADAIAFADGASCSAGLPDADAPALVASRDALQNAYVQLRPYAADRIDEMARSIAKVLGVRAQS